MAAGSLVWPMAAMAGIVFAVAVRMFATRLGEMKRRRIHPQQVASSKQMAETMEDVRASDHFRNLFEAPVLFFVACLAALQTGVDGAVPLALAWVFVVFRALQAIEACGRNKVMRRAQYYGASMLALLALWVALALAWAGLP